MYIPSVSADWGSGDETVKNYLPNLTGTGVGTSGTRGKLVESEEVYGRTETMVHVAKLCK